MYMMEMNLLKLLQCLKNQLVTESIIFRKIKKSYNCWQLLVILLVDWMQNTSNLNSFNVYGAPWVKSINWDYVSKCVESDQSFSSPNFKKNVTH